MPFKRKCLRHCKSNLIGSAARQPTHCLMIILFRMDAIASNGATVADATSLRATRLKRFQGIAAWHSQYVVCQTWSSSRAPLPTRSNPELAKQCSITRAMRMTQVVLQTHRYPTPPTPSTLTARRDGTPTFYAPDV